MVTPGGVADVESGGLELLEELTDDAESTSSGEGLDRGDSGVTNEGTVPSEEDSSSSLVESLISINWRVFLVERFVGDDHLLGFPDNWENVWFAIVVSVSSDTQVNSVWVLIVLVTCGQVQNRISRGLSDVSKLGGLLGRELVVQKGESVHFRLRK